MFVYKAALCSVVGEERILVMHYTDGKISIQTQGQLIFKESE